MTRIDSIYFTIAIPTYNGANRLPELIERLQKQINTDNITWEIIVIDNNSSDNTAELIRTYLAHWQFPFPLKYYLETKQGAAFARARAVKESQAKFIGFLDDDNYPTANWVAAAYAFSQKYTKAGAFASQIHPDWETKPSETFVRCIAPFLAITERGNLPLIYKPHNKLLPPSAGLVVNRRAWLDSVPQKPILTGRTKNNTLTGEDLEMLSYIQKHGWEIWYNPEMEIYHQIPNWRLQKEYLLPFFKGIGLSRFVTRMANLKPWEKPIFLILYLINDLRKILFHLLKYRFSLRHNLVALCELQLFFSSLISPLYLWKNGYLNRE